MNTIEKATLGLIGLYILSLGGAALAAPPAPTGQVGVADGPTLTTASGRPSPGYVEEFHPNGTTDWKMAKWASAHGVQRLEDGNILMSYANYSHNCDRYDGKCAKTGVQIWSPPPNETLQWEWQYEVRTGLNSEVHDANYYPDTNTVVLVEMEYESLIVLNRTTKDIIYRWNASEFYEPPEDPRMRDWLHINDVDRIAPETYMISVRNAHQVLIVEQGEGVVEVINKDDSDTNDGLCTARDERMIRGNPICGDPDVFRNQHDPQWLGDGKVLLADSRNDRIVELHRTNGTWNVTWAIYEVNGYRISWPRDANRLQNGNTLIGDTRTDRVMEVDREGNVVWQVHHPGATYAALRNDTEYPVGNPYPVDENANRGRDRVIPVSGLLYSIHGSLQFAGIAPMWFSAAHMTVGIVVLFMALGVGMGSVIRKVRNRGE